MPEKESAAPIAVGNGAESSEKATKLPAHYTLGARLDAIANAVDPHCADLDALDAIVTLADEVLGGAQ